MQKVENGRFLGKMASLYIALLFGQIMVFLGTFYFMLENEESRKWTIFGKNGKPIALLFGQKFFFLGTF